MLSFSALAWKHWSSCGLLVDCLEMILKVMYQCLPYVVQQKKLLLLCGQSTQFPCSSVQMMHGNTWQITKQVQQISYPASRPTESRIHWVAKAVLPMGNQEYCSWDMKLTTASSIEFKMEIYMHPSICLDGMHRDSSMFSFIFILAALLLCCHVPCSHHSPFHSPSCGVGSHCIGFPFEGTRLTAWTVVW
jgi:hypothetical protein